MKNLTDFLKTVETGLDPRLLRVFVDLIFVLSTNKSFPAFYVIHFPASVIGHNTSSTSIMVQWQTFQAADSNTTVQSYTITYRALSAGSVQIKFARAPATQVELKGLKEYTKYNITVLASNLYGDGNKSAPITVSTDEDSKF